jgi:hypothetical protein
VLTQTQYRKVLRANKADGRARTEAWKKEMEKIKSEE